LHCGISRLPMSALGHKQTTDLLSRSRGCPLCPKRQLLSSCPVACLRAPVSRLCAMKFFDLIFSGQQPAPPPPERANHEASDKPQQRDWPQENTPQDGATVASFQQSVSQANRRHVSSGSQAPIIRMAFPSVGLVVLSYVPQTSAGHQTRFNACRIGFVGSLVLSDQ
jgi:hypothetical protein